MATSAFDLLREKLHEDMESLQQALSSGPISNYDDVQFMRGQYRGLMTAVYHVELMQSQYETEGDL